MRVVVTGATGWIDLALEVPLMDITLAREELTGVGQRR